MAVSNKIHMIHSMWANYSFEGFYFWTIKRKRAHSFDNEWIQLHGKANKEAFLCDSTERSNGKLHAAEIDSLFTATKFAAKLCKLPR